MVRIYSPPGLNAGLAQRASQALASPPPSTTPSRAARRRLVAERERRQRRWAAQIPKLYARADARRHRTGGVRQRYGRIWSPLVRRLFLQGLIATGNVRAAARILGVHHTTFYIHRRGDPGLAILWRRAMSKHLDELIELLVDRAKHGWDEEVWYQGKRTGTRHVIDNKFVLDVVRFLAQREKDEAAHAREQALLTAAASAKVEEWGGDTIRRGRLSPPTSVDGERFDNDDWDDGAPLRPRHALFLELMNRHRNRHPEEWEDDRHPESGFDFADWRNWLERHAEKKRAERAAKGEE